MERLATQTLIRGKVVRLYHASPTFCAGRLYVANESRHVSFAGKCYVREGDIVALRGEWVEHEKYGEQFQVESLVYELALDADGLAAWLAVHGEAQGIGPVKAKKIAEKYGEDFGQALRDEPEKIATLVGLSVEHINRLAASWAEREEFNAIATRLAAYGLSQHEIETLIGKFGGSIIPLLERDPYGLIGEVPGLGFRRVDAIAQKTGVAKGHPGRIQAGIVYALHQVADNGSTCSRRDVLLDDADELLVMDTMDGKQRIAGCLDELIGNGKRIGLVVDGSDSWCALPWPLRHEMTLAEALLAGSQANCHWPGETAIAATSMHTADLNDASQEQAVLTALRHRLSVISGAAGTGKTTIIRSIVRAYQSSSLKIALCAPTGKASRRLQQVVGHDATTIHRLLEYHPKIGFRCNADNQLAFGVVIVDEISMMDCELAYHLFQAIGPRTSVVLVGDHHQLPPVGPGALLRDCIRHQIAPISVLETCHRQAGTLKHNCNRLLQGVVGATAEKQLPRNCSPWIVHDQLDNSEKVLACIEKLYAEVLGGRYGYTLPWDVQFMTPIHKGPLGTMAINMLLQRLHQRSLGVNVKEVAEGKRPLLYIGDKVVCTRNNYQLGIMNGHQGIVVKMTPLLVNFEDRSVAIPKENHGDIELSYCLTPHKMQGSEVPVAVTIAHRTHGFMLHRNWLYTACTRARECSIIIGDEWGIRKASERVLADQRKTLLGILARQGVING